MKKTFQFGRILAKEEGRMATLESYGKSRVSAQILDICYIENLSEIDLTFETIDHMIRLK